MTNTGMYVLKHSDSQLYVQAEQDKVATLTDQTLANWDVQPGNQGPNSWVYVILPLFLVCCSILI